MCRSIAKTYGICLIVSLAGALPTEATPYQISYEANTPGSFPEDEGWERFTTGGGVSRAVENGILTLQAIKNLPTGARTSTCMTCRSSSIPIRESSSSPSGACGFSRSQTTRM